MLMQAANGSAAASSSTSTAADDKACETDSGGPVVELPLHLTEKILCHISPLGSARHAVVCKSWAATISARLARPVPHLFLYTPPSITSDGRGLVLSVPLDCAVGGAHTPSATPIPSAVRLSDTTGLQCIGATRSGRLAFAAGWWSKNVVLVNPITGAGLQSIDVGKPRLDPSHSRVLASGGDSFFTVHDDYQLTLWRRQHRGGEEAWSGRAVTGTPGLTNNIVSAVACKGVFYLLHLDGCLSKIEATSPPPLRMEKLPVESLVEKFPVSLRHDGRMLESDGEVLFVRQRPELNEDAVKPCTWPMHLFDSGFELYKLDVKEQRWTRVNELAGDRALFVSPGSSFSVRASETEGCLSNCIYFAGEKRYLLRRATSHEDGDNFWGVYSMEHSRVLFQSAVIQAGTETELCWFLPVTKSGTLAATPM